MIIFTDLDGTLLDHDSYSFAPATQALEALKARDIPLIFATSKTAAEIEQLRRLTGIVQPAIVENGAGIDWPGAPQVRSDAAYFRVRAALDRLPVDLRRLFRGFGDMSEAEIDSLTGLGAATGAARQRHYSEPGLFGGGEKEKRHFLARLEQAGVTAVQGGRFLTLSEGASKAERLNEIVRWWKTTTGKANAMTLALGDAENDVAMLEAADYGIIVANEAHAPLPRLAGEDTGRIFRTIVQGPAGWNGAVMDFIADPATFSERYRP